MGTPFPLFQREWHLRLEYKKASQQGSYPGLFWAGAALSLPLIHRALEGYGVEFLPDFHWTYSLSGIWLIWLTCLRACTGCAVSMAEAVQHHSVQLLRRLPGLGGVAALMLSKMLVTTLPLFVEWLLFLLMSLVSGPQLSEPWRFLTVGLCSMAFFCALGLWIGTSIGEPERAANNALVAVVMTLIGWSLLEYVVKGPILLGVAVIWLTLVFRSNPRMASILQGLIAVVTLLFLFTQATSLTELHLAQLSPLSAAVQPSLTRDDCSLYCICAVLIGLLNFRQLRRM